MTKFFQLSGLLFVISTTATAGTVVEIQKDNETTTAITDGRKVRMNTSPAEYAILDSSDNSITLVDQEKRQVTLVDAGEIAASGKNIKVQAVITPQGHGQPVAGYRTQKFSYSANGKQCGYLYGSKNAYQVEGVTELLTAMDIMMDKQRAALGGFAGLVDACTRADMQLVDYVDIVGLPMRTEKNGNAELEVKAIRTDVALADDVFEIPASYQVVDSSGRVVSGRHNDAGPETYLQQDYAAPQPHRQVPAQTYSQSYAPEQRGVRPMRPSSRMYPVRSGYQGPGVPYMGRY